MWIVELATWLMIAFGMAADSGGPADLAAGITASETGSPAGITAPDPAAELGLTAIETAIGGDPGPDVLATWTPCDSP